MNHSLWLSLFFVFSLNANYLVREIKDPHGKVPNEIISYSKTLSSRLGEIKNIPYLLPESMPASRELYIEKVVQKKPQNLPRTHLQVKRFEGAEVRTIVEQGPSENRINLTFLGDGYTLSEKSRFFSDVKFLVEDLFNEDTFASYKKLFNVSAVFTASKESVISDLVKKNTVFGLYRSPKGSKRAIMPGNRQALESALRLAGVRTDYPVVIANDDYYGGLGGRYAITTRSRHSGAVVLRHELGHNFGDVGEEYDGGYVYQGANFSQDGYQKWSHWLTQSKSRLNRSWNSLVAYVWSYLSEGAYESSFEVPDDSVKTEILLSGVSWEKASDIDVLIDQKKAKLSGEYSYDRSFFKARPSKPLKPGRRVIKVRNAGDSNNALASVRIYNYPEGYNFKKGAVEAFANFNHQDRLVGYRPTHSSCLMRDMLNLSFCSVDKENMWKEFLERVSLIEDVAVRAGVVVLKTLPYKVDIRWFKKSYFGGGTEIKSLRGQRSWQNSQGLNGRFVVKVRLLHDEVRSNNHSAFTSQKEFRL